MANKKGLGIIGKVTATIVAAGIGIAGAMGLEHDIEKNQLKKKNREQISVEILNKTDSALTSINADLKTLKTKDFFSLKYGSIRYPTYSDFIDAQNFVNKKIFPNIITILNEVAEKKNRMTKVQAAEIAKELKELRDRISSEVTKPAHCKNINGDGTTILTIDVKQSLEALNQAIAILAK